MAHSRRLSALPPALVLIVFLLAAVAVPASAQQPIVFEEWELVPDPTAELILDDVRLERHSDGASVVVVAFEAPVGEPVPSFSYEVNLLYGTYTTHLLTPAELAARPDNPGTTSLVSELKTKGPATEATFHACGGVRTLDPPGIELTRTYSILDWSLNGGVFAAIRAVDGCSAANPSALGTHWFIDSCSSDPTFFISGTAPICNSTAGEYHNFDFGSDTQRTDVDQTMRTCGGNGFAHFQFTHSDSGEFALFLRGEFVSC